METTHLWTYIGWNLSRMSEVVKNWKFVIKSWTARSWRSYSTDFSKGCRIGSWPFDQTSSLVLLLKLKKLDWISSTDVLKYSIANSSSVKIVSTFSLRLNWFCGAREAKFSSSDRESLNNPTISGDGFTRVGKTQMQSTGKSPESPVVAFVPEILLAPVF